MDVIEESRTVLLCDKGGPPPSDIDEAVRLVPVDFERDDLERELARAGLDSDKPVVVMWQRNMNRLSDAIVHDTLCALARALAAESRVIFRFTESADISLADYLGVRGFALVSDVADKESGSVSCRVAVARRLADRKSCCGLRRGLDG